MEGFYTAELFLYGVTDTCSFLDTPFFTTKMFFGDNNIAIQNCGTATHTENFVLQETYNSEGLPDTSSGSLCS